MPDLIDHLVGVAPGSTLDALRAKRPVARSDAQATYDGLVTDPADPTRASLHERAAIGYWVAALSRADGLADHYRRRLTGLEPDLLAALEDALTTAGRRGPHGSYPPGPLSAEDETGAPWAASGATREVLGARLAAALEHAHLLTYRPRDASPEALEALLDAGWSADGIVTLSQLVAFTHFQLRIVAGLTVLKETI